jgi:hypothetical protein
MKLRWKVTERMKTEYYRQKKIQLTSVRGAFAALRRHLKPRARAAARATLAPENRGAKVKGSAESVG